jgi:hypothetical protein
MGSFPVFGLICEPFSGLIDDAGGLGDGLDCIERRVELGVLDVFVGDPDRRENGLIDEASLIGGGAQVEVVEVVAEDR